MVGVEMLLRCSVEFHAKWSLKRRMCVFWMRVRIPDWSMKLVRSSRAFQRKANGLLPWWWKVQRLGALKTKKIFVHLGRFSQSCVPFRRSEETDWWVRRRSSSLFANAQWVVLKEKKTRLFLSVVVLVSLLSGARKQKNGQLAKERSVVIRELFPSLKDDLASVSVLVANTLASSGEFEEALNVRRTLSESGWRKQTGLSWTEANGELAVNAEDSLV